MPASVARTPSQRRSTKNARVSPAQQQPAFLFSSLSFMLILKRVRGFHAKTANCFFAARQSSDVGMF
jgi:hypothetical protein